MMILHKKITLLICLAFISFFFQQCRKWIEVEAPATSVSSGNVFSNNETAIALLTGIYTKLSASNTGSGMNDVTSLSAFGSLYTDELTLWDQNNANYAEVYHNQMSPNTKTIYWNWFYNYIYFANKAIEGLEKSGNISPLVKERLLGEAYFIRGFCYFHLVNLYGKVPLILGTDYTANSVVSTDDVLNVYQQIISDLKEAKNKLDTNYLDATLLKVSAERVRPNRYTAQALLARTYLYIGEYENAGLEASMILENRELYDTTTLKQVFIKNSREAIWQLQPVKKGINSNTGDGYLFILPETGPDVNRPLHLSSNLIEKFEVDDQRLSNWIGVRNVTVGSTTIQYPYPYKYKVGKVDVPTTEYLMVFRLAEQYLIRAEVRALKGDISGAQSDLNIIRKRAGLANTTASTKETLQEAILRERQLELFTEWGHRLFDLKRLNKVNNVMDQIASEKGGTWSSYKALLPIPLTEFATNSKLVQNDGY